MSDGRSPEAEGSFEGRPLVGDVVDGKYRIESIAGEGGMGIVYEAEHVILRCRVALKVLRPDTISSAEAVERFSVEAAAIARITSEHVVRVMDAGSLPTGAPYLVMEYLEGCDLEHWLAQRGPLAPRDVVDFALQALDGLAHAHAAGAIHRDLKPANLFLATLGDGRKVIKLLDFGVAKAVDLEGEPEPDHILGSPVYMSPEQLTNGTLDPRSDLWSLGIVLYELLSGAPPFKGALSEIVNAILTVEPRPLNEVSMAVSTELSAVVAKALARDPEERWPNAAAFARALAPHGTGAWKGSVERIDRALAETTRIRAPRRFATLENALSALEADWHAENGAATLPGVAMAEARNDPAAFGATLPAPSSCGTISTGPPPPPSVDARLRILLIDDSTIALGMHGAVLSEAGFEVRTTSSVSEFELLLDRWRPHLVLMDVQMSDVNGDELCLRVKRKFRATVPVVLLSAMRPEKLRGRAQGAGADAFFRKTGDLDSFVDFVKNICALTYSPEALPGAIPDDPSAEEP